MEHNERIYIYVVYISGNSHCSNDLTGVGASLHSVKATPQYENIIICLVHKVIK